MARTSVNKIVKKHLTFLSLLCQLVCSLNEKILWLKSSIIPEQCYYVCEEVTDDAEDTHKHVILYPDQVTASQVGGRKRRHEQLL